MKNILREYVQSSIKELQRNIRETAGSWEVVVNDFDAQDNVFQVTADVTWDEELGGITDFRPTHVEGGDEEGNPWFPDPIEWLQTLTNAEEVSLMGRLEQAYMVEKQNNEEAAAEDAAESDSRW